MKTSISGAVVILAIVIFGVSTSLFTVDQRQRAMVFRLGEIVSVKSEPGLYWKLPLIEDVRVFDARIHTVDTEEPERFLTSEKKNV
ncbi:MAG: SPFH domain-containing protein, partial [Betaproteobacteria bacterium]